MDIPQPLGNFRLLAPSPLEFPLTFRGVGGGGMDVFWNHTFFSLRSKYHSKISKLYGMYLNFHTALQNLFEILTEISGKFARNIDHFSFE